MARNPDTTDILIAGAGPVGLMAAARLRQLGLTVRVLEAAADPVLAPDRMAPDTGDTPLIPHPRTPHPIAAE